jgi:outer membrane lipoprotein-sorting protein
MVQYKSRPALLAVLASVMLLTTGIAGVAFAGTPSTTVAQTDETTTDEPDGEEVIDSFTERLNTLDTVEFTRITETESNGETMESTERVSADLDAFQKRTEVVNSTFRNNITTVVNESTSVTYNEDENTVTEYEYRGDILLPMLEQLANESAIEYEYLGTDTVDGQDVYVLEGTPTEQLDTGADTSLTVHVGTETHFPAQIAIDVESSEHDYNYSSTITYENVTLNEDIPDSTFDIDVPDDATDPTENLGPDISTYDTHDALQSNAELSVPSAELAEGYEFDQARIIDGDSYYTVSSTYTDGMDRITVSVQEENPFDYGEIEDYEEVSVGETTGYYADYDEFSFLHWDSDGQSFSLYGQLSEEETFDIAASVADE